MTIRLTTPEAFDRLIDFLEKERDLVWPDVFKGMDKTYRDYFIENVKDKMKTDTVFLHVEWKFNAQKPTCLESEAYYTVFSEIDTDVEYVEEGIGTKEDGE